MAARAQRLFAATGLNVRFGPALLLLQMESPRYQIMKVAERLKAVIWRFLSVCEH